MQPWHGRPALRIFVGVCFLAVGAIGPLALMASVVLAWQAHQHGDRVGTLTLTEFTGCDRFKPPQQRCGWYGDFVSDDGAVVRRHQELVGGLPKGAQAGETLRARDVGVPGLIYRLDDTGRPGRTADLDFFAVCTGMFVIGLALTRPGRFGAWLRSRSSRRARP
jgi:hypothetical protein